MSTERDGSATLSSACIVSLNSTKDRIPSLDSLRGIAILMVIFAHFVPSRISLGAAESSVISLGRGGVILFFLLSGYLVFRNIEKQDAVTFISRRLFKIFPAYWVNVLLIAVFAFLFGKESISTEVVLSNFFMVQDVFHKDSMSGVFWTLLIEVKFYLFLAVQHFLLRDRGILIVLAGLIGLNFIIWLTRGHASLLLTFFPAFYVGIQIRRAETSGWSHAASAQTVGVSVLVASSLLAFDEYFSRSSAAYILIEAAMLVFFLRASISNAMLGFFGRISYSHYLYHTAAGYIVLALIPGSNLLAFDVAVIAMVIALTTVVAFISYRFVEVPVVVFGKRHERLWIRTRVQGLP